MIRLTHDGPDPWRECPTCTTHIRLCDRCGADRPDRNFIEALRGFQQWPPGYIHTDASADVRLCSRCQFEFMFLAHQWAGCGTEGLEKWIEEQGLPPVARYEIIPATP